MDRTIFEDVRCFHGLQTAELKPITLLVGENSTGKSTLLALTRMAWDIGTGNPGRIDFNEPPFKLGAFQQIANYRGGKGGRARSFQIGANFSVDFLPTGTTLRSFLDEPYFQVMANFEEEKGQPALKHWGLYSDRIQIEIFFGHQEEAMVPVVFATPFGKLAVIYWEELLRVSVFQYLNLIIKRPMTLPHAQNDKKTESLDPAGIEVLDKLTMALASMPDLRPQAFAPVRSRPQRTYDPIKDSPEPEGSHVPMRLASVARFDDTGWQHLRSSLRDFGQASGLFKDIDIRPKARQPSDPFQIMFKVSSPSFNFIDVGYGVSQVLPIIVEALQGDPGSTYLLQQPEVHLHPKAQAALASFLGTLAKTDRKRFLIETHSDYMIDRIRMDVRDGKLASEDVCILYFDRDNGGVKIHALHIDELGNIVGAPSGYRDFFLVETSRSLIG